MPDPPPKGSLLLVDFSNLVHKALFAYPHLSFAGRPTGALYGFVQQLCSAAVATRASSVLVCRDCPPYKRLQLYPQYKADRRREQDPKLLSLARWGKAQVQQFLRAARIACWIKEGYEADDLLYAAAAYSSRHLASEFSGIVVLSSDSDLMQLLRLPKVALYRGRATSRGTAELYTKTAFVREYGIKPENWPWVIALAGSHNGVPGLPGVGIKTACRIVAGKGKHSRQELTAGNPALEVYHRLAVLPYDRGMGPMPNLTRLNPGGATRYLARWGIRITDVMRTAFEQLA